MSSQKQNNRSRTRERREPYLDIPRDSLGEVPPYTESLDAKIPGENIISTSFEPRSGKWTAIDQSKDGRLYIGIGNTEVLARRIAGLYALQGERNRAEAGPHRQPTAEDLTDLAAVLMGLIEQVRMNNEFRATDPDGHKDALTKLEVACARLGELLSHPLVFLPLVLPTLCYIATKFSDAVIGELAKTAIADLRTLIGG